MVVLPVWVVPDAEKITHPLHGWQPPIYSEAVTTTRHPNRRRPDASLRAALYGFTLRLGVYGSLGLATWAHWWVAVRP